LFSDDDVYKQVSQLSGGERSRLALARLTLEKSNLLILDEPTNHLDILARETLEEVLGTYDGSLLFVSHDRFFIDSIANRVWTIEDNRLVQYLGNYTDMQRARDQRNGARTAAPPAADVADEPVSETTQPARNRGVRRQLDKDLRAARKRFEAAERAVGKLEAMLNDINDALGVATADQDIARLATLGVQYDQAQSKLDQVYDEWSQAGAELDGLVREAEALEQGQRA
jgi:ATP-binding cassette subfamily F protein 3